MKAQEARGGWSRGCLSLRRACSSKNGREVVMKGVGIGLGALSVAVVVAFGALAIPSAVEAGSIHLFNHPRPRADRFQNSYYGYYPTCWRRFPPGWACPLRE